MNLDRIKDIIYNNIFYIALYCSVTSIILYVTFLFSETLTGTLLDVLSVFSVSTVDLTFFRFDFFKFSYYVTDTMYTTRSTLTPLFILLFFVGTMLYLVSKKKENRLLNFCFSILFIAGIRDLIEFTFIIYFQEKVYSYPFLIIQFFKTILMLFISYTYLKKSFQHAQLIPLEGEGIKIFLNNSGDVSTLKHVRASKWQRFWHYCIDSFLIIALFSKYVFFIPISFINELSNTFGDRFSTFILYFIASTIYYLLFETLFKTTPGKYLMNTSVINYKEGKINFGQIVARTLSRRIPFEAFSFFSSIGWHDKLSSTTVAKQQSDKMYGNVAKIILIVFGILLVANAVINFIDII